jgi:sn-glycerol 3-phosphate transport system substrate-binding protein
VKFASTPAIQAFFSSNTGYYPPNKGAYAVQDMKDALVLYPQFQIAIDELRSTLPSAATQGAVFGTFVKARANIQGAMEQFITGKIPTAKQALDGAAKMSASELAEYNSMAQ